MLPERHFRSGGSVRRGNSSEWWQTLRLDVIQHGEGAVLDEIVGFRLPDPPRCHVATSSKIRRSPPRIMRIGRQNVHAALVEHAFGPILRPASERPPKRAASDLHEDASVGKPANDIVLFPNPAQPLGMRENRYVAGHLDSEEEFLEAHRSRVMRRLDKHIARVPERQQMPCPQPLDECRNDMIVGTRHQFERNTAFIKLPLKPLDRCADLRAGIVIDARQNMRCARDVGHTLLDEHSGHGQGRRQVRCAIVNSRQQMTVKVEH